MDLQRVLCRISQVTSTLLKRELNNQLSPESCQAVKVIIALLKNSSQFEETVLSQVHFIVGLTFQMVVSHELSASPLCKVLMTAWWFQ